MPETTPVAETKELFFELLEEQSPGSVGKVFKARKRKSARVIALRIVDVPEWLDEPSALVEKILGEARGASKLVHPNIARVVSGALDGLKVFVASDLVEGPTLKQALSERIFSVPESIAIVTQLLTALDYANDKGIFHYWMNPANIKLLPDGTIKVLDFGIIQDRNIVSQTPVKTLANQHYYSPEQMRNRPLDKTSNLFSAASIFYTMCTGRNPFTGTHLGEVERNVIFVEPVPASRVRQSVSDDVSKIILKALAKNPQDRFQSGQELIAALAKPAVSSRATPTVASAVSSQAKLLPANSDPEQKLLPVAAASLASNSSASREKGPRTAIIEKISPSRPDGALIQRHWKPILAIAVAVLVLAGLSWSYLNRSEVPPVSETVSVPPKGEATSTGLLPAPAGVPPPAPAVGSPGIAAKPAKNKKRESARVTEPSGPAAVTSGELSVSSVPQGAAVQLDGQSETSWITPQVISNLTAGTHTLTVSKVGYATETRSLSIPAGDRAMLDIKLNAVKGWVTIAGTPSGSGISVNGRDTGKLSPAEIMLDPGPQTIVLHKDGYLDSKTLVNLKAGENLAFSPALQLAGRADSIKVAGSTDKFKRIFGGHGPASGMVRVQIKSQPKGATILINGAQLSKQTPADFELAPGSYDITLQVGNYKPVHKTVTAEAGKLLKIDEQFAKE